MIEFLFSIDYISELAYLIQFSWAVLAMYQLYKVLNCCIQPPVAETCLDVVWKTVMDKKLSLFGLN